MTDDEYVEKRFREAKPFADGHGLRGPNPEVVRIGMTQGASGIPPSQQIDIPEVPAASTPYIPGSTDSNAKRQDEIDRVIIVFNGTPFYCTLNGKVNGPI